MKAPLKHNAVLEPELRELCDELSAVERAKTAQEIHALGQPVDGIGDAHGPANHSARTSAKSATRFLPLEPGKVGIRTNCGRGQRACGYDLRSVIGWAMTHTIMHLEEHQRIARLCDDAYVRDLASAVAGKLGGRVGIAPRIFLKKLVADVLDRIDQFSDFDPRQHYALTVSESELTAVERNAATAKDVDDIELDP